MNSLCYDPAMLDRKVTRKPEWIRHKIPLGKNFNKLKSDLRARGLYTVCEEAKCPNISECWAERTATIMILGEVCTRACKFCNVKTGDPQSFINENEIAMAAQTVGEMELKYVVVTSVDRDDLPDYGASHFAKVVSKINADFPDTKVEVLIPDFNLSETAMHTLASSKPFVIAQNLETVKRLTHPVRDRRAGYEKTLQALQFYHEQYPDIPTKTSLMVGLGETTEELYLAMDDLISVGVKILTIGQYLQPSRNHLAVQRYYRPEEYDSLKNIALEKGFEFVAAGPMVRSSYKAGDYLKFLQEKGHNV